MSFFQLKLIITVSAFGLVIGQEFNFGPITLYMVPQFTVVSTYNPDSSDPKAVNPPNQFSFTEFLLEESEVRVCEKYCCISFLDINIKGLPNCPP